MFEYASLEHSKNEVPLDESVFDDTLLDKTAEQLGSYDEARRRLGIKAPEYETPKSEAELGAFVTLDARTLAVQGILASINLANKAGGATRQAEITNSDFNRRYKDPEEAASNMRFGAKRHLGEHFDTLNATGAMINAGFELDYVNFYKNRLRDRKKSFEGIGRKSVAIRKKEAEKVEQTAKNSKL